MSDSFASERARLEAGLDALAITTDAGTVDRLLEYLELLCKWNRSYNLVAQGELDALVSRHLLDSLAIRPYLAAGALLDVGTGAGFPGLPLALVEPERPVVLLDSGGKKVRFLNHVLRQLGVTNASAVQARAESYKPGSGFSTIVSRAFASLGDFVRAVQHLAGPDTRLLALKGRHPEQELAGLPTEAELVAVQPLQVPGLTAERNLVILKVSR